MDTKEIDSKVFRVAALVYAETGGITKKSAVIRKLIQAAYVDTNNKPMSISELVQNISKLYDIDISKDEIIGVLDGKYSDRYFQEVAEGRNIKYVLTDKRFENLLQVDKKNIGEFIEQFISLKGFDESVKDAIYQYLYYVLQNNIQEFESVLNNEHTFSVLPIKGLTEEKENAIRDFMEWENAEKNKALLAFMGYALEYVMLTSDSKGMYGTHLGEIFSNKKLSLDTNILYYCIGVNGEEFQNANELLLKKCNQCGANLFITQETDDEFKNTLNHYVEEIRKYESHSIHRYWHYIKSRDMYAFYLEWKRERKNYNNPDYFRQYILTEYHQLLRTYKIQLEKKSPYGKQDQESMDVLERYCQEISYKGTKNYDAHNILWVEKRREGDLIHHGSSFADTAYFFMSPHRDLRRWDCNRHNDVPVVIAPDIWLLLMNRFIARSNDDYKSFISFINIKPAEPIINNKEFYMIVQAVETVTQDIDQQDYVIDTIVNQKFKYLGDSKDNVELTANEIQSKTVDEATNILQEKLKEMEGRVAQLESNNQQKQDLHGQELAIKDQQNYEQLKEKDQEIQKSNERNEMLVNKLVDHSLLRRRVFFGLILIGVNGFLIWQIVDIFVNKAAVPVSVAITEKVIENTVFANKPVYEILIWVATLIIVVIDYNLSKIFWNKDTIKSFREDKKEKLS